MAPRKTTAERRGGGNTGRNQAPLLPTEEEENYSRGGLLFSSDPVIAQRNPKRIKTITKAIIVIPTIFCSRRALNRKSGLNDRLSCHVSLASAPFMRRTAAREVCFYYDNGTI